MGYGLTDKFDLSIGHSNLLNEWEFSLNYAIFKTKANSKMPLTINLYGGGQITTETGFENNKKFNIGFIVSYLMSKRISFLILPAFSSNTNNSTDTPESSFVIGSGIKLLLKRDFSLIAEWLPVISGFKNISNGWGAGFEYRIGKHIFQVFILNSSGITFDQFLPGGDLLISKGNFRIGFNIFREF